MPSLRTLHRNHDFTALWTGQTVSELGSRIGMFAFPLLAWQLTHSALAAAGVEAANLVGTVFAVLPAGVLADRFDRRRIMRYASAIGLLANAGLAAAIVLGVATAAELAVVAALTGISAGLFSPAESAAVRTIVRDEDLSTALSQLQARQHVAALLGGPIGGALYAMARSVPFLADAISFAVSWVTLGRIRADLSPARDERVVTSARADLREGIAFTMMRPFFRTIVIWSALANLVVNAVFFVAVLRLIKVGIAPAAIGLVDTAAGVAGILGALAAPAIIDRFATGKLTVLIAWSFVPLAVPMVLWNQPAVVAATLAVGLFLNPAGNAGIQAYRVAHTPQRMQGRVSSGAQFLSMSVMPLAPVVGGALMSTVGGPIAIAALGALTGLIALIVTLSRTVRAVPRPVVWQADLARTEDAAMVSAVGAETR